MNGPQMFLNEEADRALSHSPNRLALHLKAIFPFWIRNIIFFNLCGMKW